MLRALWRALLNVLQRLDMPAEAHAPSSTPSTLIAKQTKGESTMSKVRRSFLIEKLRRDEGAIPHAYADSEGYLTIGIGRLCDSKFPNSGLTDDEMNYLLENDIDKVEKQLEKSFSYYKDLDDARQYVLIQMCFNLGLTRLKKFRRFFNALEKGDYMECGRQMEDSKWWSQVGARAKRLRKVMETGDLTHA